VSFVSRMPCKAAKMISGEYFNVPGMQQDRYISKLASFCAIALMLFSIFALCAQNLKKSRGSYVCQYEVMHVAAIGLGKTRICTCADLSVRLRISLSYPYIADTHIRI